MLRCAPVCRHTATLPGRVKSQPYVVLCCIVVETVQSWCPAAAEVWIRSHPVVKASVSARRDPRRRRPLIRRLPRSAAVVQNQRHQSISQVIGQFFAADRLGSPVYHTCLGKPLNLRPRNLARRILKQHLLVRCKPHFDPFWCGSPV